MGGSVSRVCTLAASMAFHGGLHPPPPAGMNPAPQTARGWSGPVGRTTLFLSAVAPARCDRTGGALSAYGLYAEPCSAGRDEPDPTNSSSAVGGQAVRLSAPAAAARRSAAARGPALRRHRPGTGCPANS